MIKKDFEWLRKMKKCLQVIDNDDEWMRNVYEWLRMKQMIEKCLRMIENDDEWLRMSKSCI
jgi:hypothetical protein